MFLLEPNAAELGDLIDPIQLHFPRPVTPCESEGGGFTIPLGGSVRNGGKHKGAWLTGGGNARLAMERHSQEPEA